MYYFLFFVYLALATWLITRVPFVKKTGLPGTLIAWLFIIKVAAGIAIGWITEHYFPNSDYWVFNADGQYEYQLLIHHTKEFLTNIFSSPYENSYGNYFNAVGSYWNDLSHNIILKPLAVINLLSQGNYYINSIFFNWFGFLGPVALYRVFSAIYKSSKWPLIIGCFLLPSAIYFSSGIGKDLVVFTMICLYGYALYNILYSKRTTRRMLLLLLSFVFILLLRNFVAVSLIPASVAILICAQKKWKPIIVFTAVYMVGLGLLVLGEIIAPSVQPLKVITQRQTDFLNIPAGTTSLPVHKLEPTIKSFISNLPWAIDHGLLRPHLWDKLLLLPFAFELLIYELLILIVVFRFRRNIQFGHPFIVFVCFFSLFMLLITGYVIPFSGAIIRYRSIYLPLFITPVLCSVFLKNVKK